jgi:hypothetical protein
MDPKVYYETTIAVAKELEAYEKRGRIPDHPKFDFSVINACAVCQREGGKLQCCSACKAVLYCSQKVIHSFNDSETSLILSSLFMADSARNRLGNTGLFPVLHHIVIYVQIMLSVFLLSVRAF